MTNSTPSPASSTRSSRPSYAKVSLQANGAYLDTLAGLDPGNPDEQTLHELSRKVVRKGRSHRGLNPADKKDLALVRTVARGEHALNGFRNVDIREELFGNTRNKKKRRRITSRASSRILLAINTPTLQHVIMKSLALILLLGFGCSPADKAQTSAESFSDVPTISENQPASTTNPYKQLYFDYEAKVLEALSSDLDLNYITDEFVSHAEFHIPIIYLSKQSEDGNWDSLVEKYDPQLHIILPAIHYGNFEDVHVSTIQEGMIFLETSMTTNRSYPHDIYIKMVVNPDKNTIPTSSPILLGKRPFLKEKSVSE